MGSSASCQRAVVDATDDFLFKSGNLTGLVADAVSAALGEYTTDMADEMGKIRREARRLTLNDGRSSERAAATTGAADYENKSATFDRLTEAASENLRKLEALEERIAAVKKDFDGFAGKGGPLMVKALVAMLEQRLAVQPGGVVDEAEAKRMIAALGLRLDAPTLGFGPAAAAVEAAVTTAIDKLQADMDRSQSRMEKAEDERANLYGEAVRAAINASPIRAGKIFSDSLREGRSRKLEPPPAISLDDAEEPST